MALPKIKNIYNVLKPTSNLTMLIACFLLFCCLPGHDTHIFTQLKSNSVLSSNYHICSSIVTWSCPVLNLGLSFLLIASLLFNSRVYQDGRSVCPRPRRAQQQQLRQRGADCGHRQEDPRAGKSDRAPPVCLWRGQCPELWSNLIPQFRRDGGAGS